MLTAQLYASQPQAVEPPQTAQLHNSFVFRFALCAHLLDLKRIAAGGAKGANPAGLRNDAIDATFAAFATFFDGLITADAKALELHENASFLLKQFRLPDGLEAQPEQPGAAVS
jgi:2,4-dienoyl-CoA reductase-like NADH-dependent reductase (Old Yellow Enzyme family)